MLSTKIREEASIILATGKRHDLIHTKTNRSDPSYTFEQIFSIGIPDFDQHQIFIFDNKIHFAMWLNSESFTKYAEEW